MHASRIRSAIGEPALVEGTSSCYRLVDDALDVDVDEFERPADRGREGLRAGRPDAVRAELEQALALYRGDLVEANAYEEWATAARASPRATAAALDDLADAYVALGSTGQAVGMLERTVELDPVREARCFHASDAAEARGRYELVTILGAVHDMSRPVEVLRAARAIVGDRGTAGDGRERG